MRVFKFCLVFVWVLGCQSGRIPSGMKEVSYRPIGLAHKPSKRVMVRSRLPKTPEKKPELYEKNNRIVMKKQRPNVNHASLYRVEDERNNHFLRENPYKIGKFINIKVASHRFENQKNQSQTGDENQDVASGDDSKKEKTFEEKMIASFPNISDLAQKPPLLKNIQMQVVDRLPDGSIRLETKRFSQNPHEVNDILLVAHLPYEDQMKSQPVTTSDLTDVSWYQVQNGEHTKRQSHLWEDEYSLRLSGFEEVLTQGQKILEARRKTLLNLKGRMETQLQHMAKRRRDIAAEQRRLDRFEKNMNMKVQSLQTKVTEQQALIEQQKQEIKEKDQQITDQELELKGIEADAP